MNMHVPAGTIMFIRMHVHVGSARINNHRIRRAAACLKSFAVTSFLNVHGCRLNLLLTQCSTDFLPQSVYM